MITKKEFKELADVHVYGSGKDRILALFFDWSNNHETGCGYKYMIKRYACTKAEIINDGYDFFIMNDYSNLCWYDMKQALTDVQRFKVPIGMTRNF